MKIKDFLTLLSNNLNRKEICITDEESDLYIGSVDGSTDSIGYQKCLECTIKEINLGTFAISGNERISIDIEIEINKVLEDE